jgi:hypothetical protein
MGGDLAGGPQSAPGTKLQPLAVRLLEAIACSWYTGAAPKQRQEASACFRYGYVLYLKSGSDQMNFCTQGREQQPLTFR